LKPFTPGSGKVSLARNSCAVSGDAHHHGQPPNGRKIAGQKQAAVQGNVISSDVMPYR
jgi:hypothetical protein